MKLPVIVAALLLATVSHAAEAIPGPVFCKPPAKGGPNASDRPKSCFVGQFKLIDIPGDPDHKLLGADFGFYDSNGLGWETSKNAKTDGASIPKALRPFVGTPWEEGYIRAAVIHDWYCDRRVRSWQDTHFAFYDAMIASGLSPSKAKLMFYAVYAFGPIWGYTAPGSECSVTKNCIKTIVGRQEYIVQSATYDKPETVAELQMMEIAINASEPLGGLSREDLMRQADMRHPKPKLSQKPQMQGVDR